MFKVTLSSQHSTVFFPKSRSSVPRKRGGCPSRKSKFCGNQHSEMTASLDESSGTLPLPTPKAKRFQFTRPRRGYTSRHSTPFHFRKQKVTFKIAATTTTNCSIPSDMRNLDVGILAEAMTNHSWSTCNNHLAFYKSEYLHGWHTIFYIKCISCHQLFSEFPSSKPLETDTTKDTTVNAKLRMNEVTMRLVLSVHCSGFS